MIRIIIMTCLACCRGKAAQDDLGMQVRSMEVGCIQEETIIQTKYQWNTHTHTHNNNDNNNDNDNIQLWRLAVSHCPHQVAAHARCAGLEKRPVFVRMECPIPAP